MTTLQRLEMTINDLAYKRAMTKWQKRKSIKTWVRLKKKLAEYTEKETDKIIENIVNFKNEVN